MSLRIKGNGLNFSIFAILLLLLQSARSQNNLGEVAANLESLKKSYEGNAVVLVWKDSNLIYKKEIGELNAKTQAPISGSGQWLTAALIMKLVDEGKLDLDDPVARYIPIFDKYAKSYLTLRHCLSHTTGLEADDKKIGKLFQRKRFASLEEEVNVLATREIMNNPGKEFFYGSIGPHIAARVAEVVSKKTFDRLIQEKLLRPLKMRATSFANDEGGAINPSGGARSTANDYLNFLVMLLNKGVFEGKQILSEESVDAMNKLHFPDAVVKYAPPSMQGYVYGLGSWHELDNGRISTSLCPSLFGSWPVVDHCRGYAAIFFVNTREEQPKNIFESTKGIIDDQMKGGCKTR